VLAAVSQSISIVYCEAHNERGLPDGKQKWVKYVRKSVQNRCWKSGIVSEGVMKVLILVLGLGELQTLFARRFGIVKKSC